MTLSQLTAPQPPLYSLSPFVACVAVILAANPIKELADLIATLSIRRPVLMFAPIFPLKNQKVVILFRNVRLVRQWNPSLGIILRVEFVHFFEIVLYAIEGIATAVHRAGICVNQNVDTA